MLNNISSANETGTQNDGDDRDVPSVQDAERMRTLAADAGRWFSGYLAVVGVVSAGWIVLLESVVDDGLPRIATAAGWAVFIVLASWWAERHVVYPAGATRLMTLAIGVWFAAYLFAVGPIVRGQFGDALVPWIVASAVMALPFFVVAALILRRR